MPVKKSTKRRVLINGTESGSRVSSRVLEESIQKAVKEGECNILVRADGQQGIGGRIWNGNEKVQGYIR